MLRDSNTMEIICSSLLDLMETKPISQIKVTELVQVAQISRSSFYSYFDSLDDVVQKVEDDLINGLEDEKSMNLSDLKSGSSPQLVSTLRFIHKNIRTYRLLVSQNGDPYFQIRLKNRSSRIMYELARYMGTSLSDVELQLIIENISGGRWEMYKWWATHENEVTVEQMVELTQKVISQVFSLLMDETD